MPRNHQASRQLIILKLLESNPGMTLHQIGFHINDGLDENYTERTLRRDLEALQQAGVPLFDEKGEDGKTYWTVPDEYKKTPIPLTPSELFALQCGKNLLKPLEGTFISESIRSLYQKLSPNLLPANKTTFDQLQKDIHIAPSYSKEFQDNGQFIEIIKEALEENKVINMSYTPLRTNRPLKKKINPYGLWYQNGIFYLIGYCHQQKDFRTYVVDRIKSIKMTDEVFTPDLYFKVDEYFKDAFGVFRGKPERVELIFDKPASKWVRERRWHSSQELASLPGDQIKLRFRVAVTPELIQWVLGFGSQVEVIQPENLRKTIQKEAWKLMKQYGMTLLSTTPKLSGKSREIPSKKSSVR